MKEPGQCRKGGLFSVYFVLNSMGQDRVKSQRQYHGLGSLDRHRICPESL